MNSNFQEGESIKFVGTTLHDSAKGFLNFLLEENFIEGMPRVSLLDVDPEDLNTVKAFKYLIVQCQLGLWKAEDFVQRLKENDIHSRVGIIHICGSDHHLPNDESIFLVSMESLEQTTEALFNFLEIPLHSLTTNEDLK